jgi:signal transduction histidine kinase
LARLADAADAIGPAAGGTALAETGPREVARAATAFNAMQGRIQAHLAERTQILAAISHDLQTPLTRLRLRSELIDDTVLRDKLLADLDAMQALVREGIAYARSAHSGSEAARSVDLHALLDSLVCDYTDAGQPVTLEGAEGLMLETRPQALRRLITNLVDNALKFAGNAQLTAGRGEHGIFIAVRDDGPGIAPEELQAVMQPFYRVENSRSRETGGTGLGLAIAQQLAQALGGRLALRNREEGGLEARLTLPIVAVKRYA